jgi:hypothetical protein
MDFWDNIGPTSYIKRLDHPEPEMGDRPLLTEETTVVEQRLARGRIDPERTRTEAKHVSEDNAIPDLLLEVNRLELRRMLTELGLSEEVIRSLSDPNRLRSFIAKLIVLRKLLPFA